LRSKYSIWGNPGADVDVLGLKLAYKFVHTLGLTEAPKPSVSGMELRNAFRQETARPGSRDQQLTMTQASSSPAANGTPRFDPGVAHLARVWIGGKDHYPADRKAADEVAACRPQVVAGARANRAYLARAVRYLAGPCGVRQFLDIGPGLPAPGATHTVAQAIAPASKIVYVDNDRCKSGCGHARWARFQSVLGVSWHRWPAADESAQSRGGLAVLRCPALGSRSVLLRLCFDARVGCRNDEHNPSAGRVGWGPARHHGHVWSRPCGCERECERRVCALYA
jgi:S-adenosyl methyltransferase